MHQELLNKRKKYDPRQAAKEGKKKKPTGQHKSAFPSGLLSNKDQSEEPESVNKQTRGR